MTAVYGLRNCDTCRKARKWLRENDVEHSFRDLRADGLDGPTVERWIAAIGWEALINRRGTTWRSLSDAEKQIADQDAARDLMLRHPALIKRPVFDLGGRVLVGFGGAVRTALSGRRN